MQIEYPHRHTAHCENGVTAGLLSYNGLAMSEAMAFGIGSGLFFVYLPILKIGSLPMTSYRMAPGHIFRRVTRRLNIRVEVRRYRDPEASMRDLDCLLDKGLPIACQCGVYWLPYFPPGMRFHFNAHNIVIFGREGDEYLVSDPVIDEPVRCKRDDLIKARFAKGPLAPRGRMYWVTGLPENIDLPGAIVDGIKATCRNMNVPAGPVGAHGVRFLASCLRKWPERYGQRRASQLLGNVIRMQEEIGTGGAGFRFIFAAFLQESAEVLSAPVLKDFADRVTTIGDRWREFALLGSRNCKNRASEDESYEHLAEILNDCAAREIRLFKDLKKILPDLKRKL